MRWLMLACGVAVVGCAARPLPEVRRHAVALRIGDATAPPSLSALPELEDHRSEELHRGLAAAGEIFAARLPTAPLDRAYIELAAWVEADVANWILCRRDAVEETRFQFLTSAGSDPAGRAITNAVIGLLQEDTARALLQIPVPVELDTEPEIAALFRQLVHSQADPFLESARTEYTQCAGVASDEGRELARFERFCEARAERLAQSVPARPQPLAAVRR